MADPSKTKDFENRYDNSDLQMDRRVKDIATAYTEYDEMKAYKLYLETLEIEAKMRASTSKVETIVTKADGTEDKANVDIAKLIPKASEFEQARRRVIVKLNAARPAELKQLFAEFETESMFELSSKITNFLVDKARRDRVSTKYSLF